MPRRLRHAFALGRFVARHGTISEIGLPQVAILTTAQFAAMVLLLLYLPHRLKSLVTRVVEERRPHGSAWTRRKFWTHYWQMAGPI
jgi:hypothetical protein